MYGLTALSSAARDRFTRYQIAALPWSAAANCYTAISVKIDIIKIVDQDSHLHSHISIDLSLKEIAELESKHRLKNPTDRM